MWAENDLARIVGTDITFPVLVNQQVDGITADVYIEQWPSPVTLAQGLELRGRTWLVTVVREMTRTGTQLAVSQCNKTGVLYRREATPTAYGHTYTVVDGVPFAGVWRIMSTSEKPESIKTAANLMPIGGWDWPGQVHDLVRMDDGTEWEQYGVLMSDRTALSMVLTGTAVVQLRQVSLLEKS